MSQMLTKTMMLTQLSEATAAAQDVSCRHAQHGILWDLRSYHGLQADTSHPWLVNSESTEVVADLRIQNSSSTD